MKAHVSEIMAKDISEKDNLTMKTECYARIFPAVDIILRHD